jgi:predicted DNA-binding WGR domain protein
MKDQVDNVTHSLPVTTECPIRLQFSSPERTYTILLMQDLFKQWVIMQTWSGKQQTSGGSKLRPFDDLETALAALAAIARQHEKRGLQPLQ